jgi:hypothetical protein
MASPKETISHSCKRYRPKFLTAWKPNTAKHYKLFGIPLPKSDAQASTA